MTALMSPPKPPQAAPAKPRLRRFTVDEYHRLIDAGILREGEQVELREGIVVQRMTINPPHAVVVGLTSKRIDRVLPVGWVTRVQQPVTFTRSEPQPDITVARGDERDYVGRHPTAESTGLLVEVSDSSLDEDRADTGAIYARYRIPVYWIVNINEAQVEVYTDPSGDCDEPAYRTRRDYHRDDEVPLILNGIEIARIPVRDLLP
jgi:Uma2 family endonuclease